MIYFFIFFLEIIFLFLLSRKVQTGFTRVFYKITGSEQKTIYLLAVLFLPGTFIHEISHFLMALSLLVPVGEIELMPEMIEGRKIKLGSVPIGKTDMFRRALVGFAPIIFGITIILTSLYFLISRDMITNIWISALVVYLSFEIGNTMFVSKRDLEGAWRLVIVALVFIIIFYLIGFRFDPQSFQSLFTQKVGEFFKTANIFLSIPVIINSVLVVIFKLLKVI